MKIIYIHQYFKTPEQGGAIRSYHIAKAMVQNGHDVEIITAHNSPNYHLKNIEGIVVHYLPVDYNNRFSVFKRIISFLIFLVKALVLSLKIKKDLIYATSTPLSVGAIAVLNKWLLKTPYIFEVRDLWPQVPIEMGYIKNRYIILILNYFETTIYNNSKTVIALSPGIADAIKHKCKNVNIEIIPNFSDFDFFKTDKIPQNDKITISYIGTLGKANGLDKMISLATEANLTFYGKFEFVIMGDGSEKEKIAKTISDNQLGNVILKLFSNKEDVKEQMINSDLIYVSFADYSILGNTTSPNKLFDAFAMKKIVVVNFEGWLTDLILKNNAGYKQNSKLSNTNLLSQICINKSNNQTWNDKMEASALLGKKYFEKNMLLQKLINVL